MKKSPAFLDYKADLIKRIEYSLDGELATIHIPFEEIQEYSNEYNPNVLILEEMRLIEGVVVAIAIKTYPDGKVTGKVRTSGTDRRPNCRLFWRWWTSVCSRLPHL